MYRVVLFTIVVLILLLLDALAIGLAATAGSPLLAVLFCIVAALLVWSMFAVRFGARHKPRRWPHRGATRDEYNPWLGGGVGRR
jgi:hypothetical protein